MDFLVPCGTTGESPTLTHAEHLRVVEITVEECAGKTPVLAGAGGYNTREVIEFAREIIHTLDLYSASDREHWYRLFKHALPPPWLAGETVEVVRAA